MRSRVALVCIVALDRRLWRGSGAGAGPVQAARRSRAASRSRSTSPARRARPGGSTSSSRAARSRCSRAASGAARPSSTSATSSTAGGEQGLLGLAFHPSYPKVRKLYVQYTARDGSTKVVEYRTNGTRASSPRQLFSSRDPYGNHNGGMLAFGPNGRLYFTMGDGGSGGDPENRSQNMRSLFGKLLSLNVATKGLRIEALGLRNAWRFSFDRANGDLYIGDVGQGAIEEIDYTPQGQPRPRELRLGRLRGALQVRGQGARPGQARRPGRAVQPRRRLLGHRRLRLPRLERVAPRALHLRRLLQRARLELQDRGRQVPRPCGARRSRSRA